MFFARYKFAREHTRDQQASACRTSPDETPIYRECEASAKVARWENERKMRGWTAWKLWPWGVRRCCTDYAHDQISRFNAAGCWGWSERRAYALTHACAIQQRCVSKATASKTTLEDHVSWLLPDLYPGYITAGTRSIGSLD